MSANYLLIYRYFFHILIFLISGLTSLSSQSTSPISYLDLSVRFIDLQKKGIDVSPIVKAFASCTIEELEVELDTDDKKFAFWVNVFNGFIQYVLSEKPDLYQDRGKFFNTKRISIAGQTMSFSDIEHGIIRRSAVAWSLGLFSNPFPGKNERRLRVSKRDWRIHFALNCGAKSCPPVATYHSDLVRTEFDFMTKKYLQEHTEYDPLKRMAKTTTLFSWFRGDFGGKKGVKSILSDFNITLEKPKNLEFNSYDWTLDLGNYREIE